MEKQKSQFNNERLGNSASQERFAAMKIGAHKARELLKPSGGHGNTIDGQSYSTISKVIDDLHFDDETSRSFAGMGACLPSLIRYEGHKHRNKNSRDFENTILFNHYLNSYLENLESPEPLIRIIDGMKYAIEGSMNVSDETLLESLRSAVVGQWNEQAVENCLLAHDCLCKQASVGEDEKGADLIIPDAVDSLVEADIKSSPLSLPTRGVTFIGNKNSYNVRDRLDIPNIPGFAVALNKYEDGVVLVLRGAGKPFKTTRAYINDNKSPNGQKLADIDMLMPVPRFGKVSGGIDMQSAVAELRLYLSTLPESAKIYLDRKELHKKFGKASVKLFEMS